MHSETTQVLDGLRRLVQALRDSSKSAERTTDLSGAQLFALSILGEGQPLSVNELAARTRTHQSSVSVVVTRLVDRKLVRRKRSTTDARRLELSLTARGRALVEKAPPTAQHALIDAVEGLAAHERSALARTLAALGDAMALPATPQMFFEESPRSRSRS